MKDFHTWKLRESRIEQSIRIAMNHKFVCRCYHCNFWMKYECQRCIQSRRSNGRCWCYKGGLGGE